MLSEASEKKDIARRILHDHLFKAIALPKITYGLPDSVWSKYTTPECSTEFPQKIL